jgi:hypothetical protein
VSSKYHSTPGKKTFSKVHEQNEQPNLKPVKWMMGMQRMNTIQALHERATVGAAKTTQLARVGSPAAGTCLFIKGVSQTLAAQ